VRGKSTSKAEFFLNDVRTGCPKGGGERWGNYEGTGELGAKEPED